MIRQGSQRSNVNRVKYMPQILLQVPKNLWQPCTDCDKFFNSTDSEMCKIYIHCIFVQVALRVRPINMLEVSQGARYIAHVIDKQVC